jgi:flagellar biogenesis protein FliO
VPDFSQPVEFSFVMMSIAAIFALVGLGILLVKKFK